MALSIASIQYSVLAQTAVVSFHHLISIVTLYVLYLTNLSFPAHMELDRALSGAIRCIV